MSTQAYPDPQMIFQHQYAAVKRDEVVGVLLALFLGAFGHLLAELLEGVLGDG